MKRHKLLHTVFAVALLVGCHSDNPPPSTSAPPSVTQATPDKSASNATPDSSDRQTQASEKDRVDATIVQADVRTMNKALHQGNATTIVEYTHPKIVGTMGGKTYARVMMEDPISKLQSLKVKPESLEFPEAPTFLKSNGTRFAIIPTKAIITMDGERFEVLNFQIGIMDRGADIWKYAEGSTMKNQAVRNLFPDFPDNYKFPPISRKKL